MSGSVQWEPPSTPEGAGNGAPGAGYPPGGGYPGGGGWSGGPGGGWSGGSGPVERPGVIPLRPLAVGEILDGAFATMRQNPAATLGMSAAVTAVTQLIAFLLLLAGRSSAAGLTVASLVGAALQAVATLALSAGLTVVVADAVLGKRPSLPEVWERVRAQVWPTVGVSVLVGAMVIVLFLTVIGIPVAIYLLVALSLAVPALVLEHQPVRGALGRSRTLVRTAWWRTFGILLLVLIITAVIAALIQFLLGVIGLSGPGLFSGTSTVSLSTGQLFLATIAATIANSIVAPIRAGAVALLYVDRRMRSEGLDLVLQRAARGLGGVG